MRLIVSALVINMFVLAIHGVSHADENPSSNVMTQAVIDGVASAPVPDIPQFADVIRAVQQRTGSDGPLVIYAARVTSFHQQQRCGRVAYIIGQPSSHTAWKDMSGQLNVCDDGSAPLRMCRSRPDRLVSVGSACPDGTAPVDTAEVAAAIQAAIAGGGLTPQEAAHRARKVQGTDGTEDVPGRGARP